MLLHPVSQIKNGLSLRFDFTQRQQSLAKPQRFFLMTENELAKLAVNICFNIHKEYGPGLFESAYEGIFVYEWEKLAISFNRQQGIKGYSSWS
jgi:hypothetical protein